MASEYLNYPTWKKYVVLSATVDNLPMRDKRAIFALLRQCSEAQAHDVFFPKYGFTAGAFCTWQILSDSRRPRRRRRTVQDADDGITPQGD
jgi:hypothetical protein